MNLLAITVRHSIALRLEGRIYYTVPADAALNATGEFIVLRGLLPDLT